MVAGNQVTATNDSASTASLCRFTDRFARALRDSAAYSASDTSGRQRILDDRRYAANAMAQTAASDVAEPVGRLAEAVRVHGQVLLDAGVDTDPSTAAGRDSSAREYSAAIEGIDDLSSDLCGVSLDLIPAP